MHTHIALAIAFAVAAPAAAQPVTLPAVSNVRWSPGCVTRTGPPVATLSPDRHVVSVIFQGLAAGTGALPRRLHCTLRWEVQVPQGKRGEFKAAVYRSSVIRIGAGGGQVTIRHGRKGPLWFTRWAARVARVAPEGEAAEQVNSARSLTTGCGGRATYLLDIELTTSLRGPGDDARVEVDSVDFDTATDAQFGLAVCR